MDRVEVDPEHAVPHLEVDRLGQRAVGADARVVAQHVRGAEALVRRVAETVDGPRIGDVGHDADRLDALAGEFRPCDLESGFVDVGKHHVHARFPERFGQAEPEAVGAARDHRDLAHE